MPANGRLDPSEEDFMDTKELLIEARERIQDPERWIQGRAGTYKESLGEPTDPLGNNCWCLFGAVSSVVQKHAGGGSSRHTLSHVEYEAYNACMAEIQDTLNGAIPKDFPYRLNYVGFNDYPGTEHQDVIDLLDRAIASL